MRYEHEMPVGTKRKWKIGRLGEQILRIINHDHFPTLPLFSVFSPVATCTLYVMLSKPLLVSEKKSFSGFLGHALVCCQGCCIRAISTGTDNSVHTREQGKPF